MRETLHKRIDARTHDLPVTTNNENALDIPAAAARNEILSMSVFCHGHPLAAIRERLTAQGVVTARDLRRIPSGSKVRVAGLLVIVHMPPTKSGKRVIFITLEDETGLLDAVMFPRAQKRSARSTLTSEIQTIEGRLQRQGKNGLSISVVVDRIIPYLSGSLSEVLERLAARNR
jgi:error-prone DNA polymerase